MCIGASSQGRGVSLSTKNSARRGQRIESSRSWLPFLGSDSRREVSQELTELSRRHRQRAHAESAYFATILQRPFCFDHVFPSDEYATILPVCRLSPSVKVNPFGPMYDAMNVPSESFSTAASELEVVLSSGAPNVTDQSLRNVWSNAFPAIGPSLKLTRTFLPNREEGEVVTMSEVPLGMRHVNASWGSYRRTECTRTAWGDWIEEHPSLCSRRVGLARREREQPRRSTCPSLKRWSIPDPRVSRAGLN